MAKKQTIIKMIGIKSDGKPASTHEAVDVFEFVNDKRSIRIPVPTDSCYLVNMVTAESTVKLYAHKTIENVWMGMTEDKIKIHFTKKKLVGKLIYWA